MRFRISVLGMMALVLFFAVGFAALGDPTILLASATYTTAVGLLCTALLLAFLRRGRERAPWLGFAIFGWAYLGLSFGPWPNGNGVTSPPFLTRALLDYLQGWAAPHDASFFIEPSGERLLTPTQVYGRSNARFNPFRPPTSPVPPNRRVFDWLQQRRVGHSLASILFGLVGAFLGRILAKDDQSHP